MKIRSDDKYIEYKIDDHIDKAYSLRTGATVRICKPYEEYKEIRVRRIPITWDMEDVKRHAQQVLIKDKEFNKCGHLPRKLHMLADNCFRENKNRYPLTWRRKH